MDCRNRNVLVDNDSMSPKSKLEWTDELHFKFMDAVNHLGGIMNAVASQIWTLMNEQGLTREHVGSHLQKIRGLKIKGPQRMNKNAIIHLRYLQTSLGGPSVIKDNWSHFLRVCAHLRLSSYSSNNNNNVSGSGNINLQVGGSSSLSPDIHDHHILENFDLGSFLNLLMSEDNIVGQDNSGGHHMVDPTNDINYQQNINEVVPPPAPAPQQTMNYNLESAGTSQQSLNQHHYSSPPQPDDDNDFDWETLLNW